MRKEKILKKIKRKNIKIKRKEKEREILNHEIY